MTIVCVIVDSQMSLKDLVMPTSGYVFTLGVGAVSWKSSK